jgi:hypothetical protein
VSKEERIMKPLMKYRASYNNQDSWALSPIGETSIIAGYYDPTTRVLALIHDSIKEGFTMAPKLDSAGDPELINKMGGRNSENIKQERVKIQKYFEHYLSHPDDIKWFLEKFVENNFEFKEEEQGLITPATGNYNSSTTGNLIIT